MIQPAQAGLYHCAPAGFTSRLGLAAFALQCAIDEGMALKASPATVRGVPTSDMPSAARRPLNSRLDTTRIRETFGIQFEPWEAGVREAVAGIARAAMRR